MKVTIVGAGYVGLPMAIVAAKAGCAVRVLDLDEFKTRVINRGQSYIEDVSSEELCNCVGKGGFPGGLYATTDPALAYENSEVVLICVPTPLNKTKDPDVSFVVSAVEGLLPYLREGMLISLESTVYPGFTREVVAPMIEAKGLQIGEDVFLSFSPERVDPGNKRWNIKNTPKVVGGLTSACTHKAVEFYKKLVDHVIPVYSCDTAEMVKILENTFRAVNIGLANEFAIMCDRLGLSVWDVIEAAATKPFGFMPFYPGPGLGGHCLPCDPHYLAWKLRTVHYNARFIELADRVNSAMPEYVVDRLARELNRAQKPVSTSKVLVVGVAYKPNVSDIRESPAIEIIRELRARGAFVIYHDPLVQHLDVDDLTLASETLPGAFHRTDAAIIVTDHSGVDYQRIAENVPLVLDTRNATEGLGSSVVRL